MGDRSRGRRRGFTLIELLVVVSIIGVLAAVALPQFTHRQGKAVEARLKADLRNAANAMEAYYTDNAAYFSGDCASLPMMSVSSGATCTVTTTDPISYAITAAHPQSPTSCQFVSNVSPNLTCF